ncbi:HAMP domain-containing histidine kinase [Candidatus Sumerlaeota bacterium]|nr:HAMP domain-containing histidine kinase [Candidatus Sumerlaeota bacterium]
MKKKLLIAFLIIVLVPQGVLFFMGIRMAPYEQERVQARFKRILEERLGEINRSLMEFIRAKEEEMLSILHPPNLNPELYRNIEHTNPLIRQIFFLDETGRILYPSPDKKNDAKSEFFIRTQGILNSKELLFQHYYIQHRGVINDIDLMPKVGGHDWYVWNYGKEIHYIFWTRANEKTIIAGAELNQTRLLAEIIGYLPDTRLDQVPPMIGQITFSVANGETLYHWGVYEPEKGENPLVTMALSYPLHSLALEYYVPPEQWKTPFGKGIWINFLGIFFSMVLVTSALAIYVYREHSREMRESSQRMSFVNQVSHELKTPLTNIRLYAELLDQRIPEEYEKERKHVEVICSESQRLSRLIGNILSFSRKQRDKLKLHPTKGIIDETIRSVIKNFLPALENKGVKVEWKSGAGETVHFDKDAVEQILGNLFSNVEKYSVSQGILEVISNQSEGKTTIIVSDQGPGIPPSEREKIFLPFYRISNKLTDGVTGTGIGLSISRDLARMHGGDLILIPSEKGASFQLTLETPLA